MVICGVRKLENWVCTQIWGVEKSMCKFCNFAWTEVKCENLNNYQFGREKNGKEKQWEVHNRNTISLLGSMFLLLEGHLVCITYCLKDGRRNLEVNTRTQSN